MDQDIVGMNLYLQKEPVFVLVYQLKALLMRMY